MGWISTPNVLLHEFGQFRQRSWKRAGLAVDTQNLTDTLRLSASVGLRAYRTTHAPEKDLRPTCN